jgi:hypothetical protein
MRTKRISMNMMVFLDHLIVFPVCVCIIYALWKNYSVRRQQRLGFVSTQQCQMEHSPSHVLRS